MTNTTNSSASGSAGVDDSVVAKIVERYLRGELSAPVTIMQLLIETEDYAVVRAVVAAVAEEQQAGGSEAASRAAELRQVLDENSEGCARIAEMLKADVDSSRPARTVEEGVAFSQRLFDWSVQQSEEASVALYSLGNPELLKRATDEIVSELEAWGTLTPETSLLDLGCGIGRMLIALAPRVAEVTGIDVSSRMVDVAQRRTEGQHNVRVMKADGQNLNEFGDRSFDVVLAVDSFPYIRQSGYALCERFFAESSRVLKPGGEMIILNYSYSDDDEADRMEVSRLAREGGFDIVINGERPFQLWDGLAFRMVKSPRSSG